MATEYIWRDDAFELVDRQSAGEIWVADSWRSEGGRVAAFEYHAGRFEDAVGRVTQESFVWPRVWQELATVIARAGDASLFPRISLEPAGLILTVRPCQPRRRATSLAVLGTPDPRLTPLTKGPDIPRLAAAKATATADDIILRDADGACLETATGALVHWLDGGIVISNRFDRQLPSVTLRQVYDRAVALGIAVSFRPVWVAEFAAGPAWFVNSVHGVSPVPEVRLGEASIAVPAHPDAEEWQNWWWRTLAPISGDTPQDPSLRVFAT